MMISDVSVKRPVFAIMMTAALLVLGAFSYRELGLDLMPKTDAPVVTVNPSGTGSPIEVISAWASRHRSRPSRCRSILIRARSRIWGAPPVHRGTAASIAASPSTIRRRNYVRA